MLVRYMGKQIPAESVGGSPPPKVGDTIYVDSAWYLSHGEDDFEGGRVTVSSVRVDTSAGEPTWFVSITERPGHSYNWAILKERQAELAAEFGDKKGHPDPDNDPEFNRW